MTQRLTDSPLDATEAYLVLQDAARFRELLDSPVCGLLIRLVEAQWYAEMKAATSADALLVVQAKATVLDDVLGALRGVLSAAERDAHDRQQRQNQQQQQQQQQSSSHAE